MVFFPEHAFTLGPPEFATVKRNFWRESAPFGRSSNVRFIVIDIRLTVSACANSVE